MKKIICFLSLLLFAAVTYGQQSATETIKVESHWKLSGITGLNFSQTALKHWAGGGESALAGNVYLNGELNYKKDRWTWDNSLALDYGLTRIKDSGVRKSTDKIELASKLGYGINEKLYYAAMFDFKTQFAKGYNYPDNEKHFSNFMAPGYTTFSIGLDYKPCDKLSLYYSPLAIRTIYVFDKELDGMYGVPEGKNIKSEVGTYFKTTYKNKIWENVDLITKADFFTPYNKDFGNVVVDWDVLISMKINPFLNATLNTTLRYDDNVDFIENGESKGPKVQWKQIFGLGLAYKF